MKVIVQKMLPCLLAILLVLMTACSQEPPLEPAEPTASGEGGTAAAVQSTAGTEEETARPKPPSTPPWSSAFTQKQVVWDDVYTTFSAYNKAATPEYLIPALEQGFVPQGMDVWEEKQWLVISGYFSSGAKAESSMLFAVDLVTGALAAEYTLWSKGGSAHTSHVGGVAVTEKNLYLSNSSKLYRIPLSQLTDAAPKGRLTIAESIAVPVRASFCNASGGYLWVGDFYISGDSSYALPAWRKDTGLSGAWCVGYRLTDETEDQLPASSVVSGVSYRVPDLVLSIDQKVQGITVLSDGSIAISRSYGRKVNSQLVIYPEVLSKAAAERVTLASRKIPVLRLNAEQQPKSYIAPPMMQGLCVRGTEMYILFESGAEMYRTDGGTYPTDHIWLLRS